MRAKAIFLFLITAPLFAMGQDYHFANSIEVPQLLNPAATGSGSVHRTQVAALYRGQWDNLTSQNSYQGESVFADIRFCLQNSKKNYYALGIGIQHDFSPLGYFYNSNGMLTASYHHHLGNGTFGAVGGSLGGLAMGIQPEKLKFDEQFQNGTYDPSNSNGEKFLRANIFQPDLSSGFVLYNNKAAWSVGISLRHLNKPVYSLLGDENRLGVGMVFYGTCSLWKTHVNKQSIQARALYRRQSVTGSNSLQWQTMAGVFYQTSFSGQAGMKMTAGAYLRGGSLPKSVFTLNTLVPAIQLGNDQFSATISYDVDIARTRSRFAGGLEIVFQASFGKTDRCIVCSGF
jgi:type IX secretion system PorP/SprF family membrane protein